MVILRTIPLLVAILLSVSACSAPPLPPTLPAPDPSLHPVSLASIDELERQPEGVYEAPAYVIDASACPSCEGPHPCAPCSPPSITLSSRPPSQDGTQGPTVSLDPGGRGLEAFERGKRYRFTARVEHLDGRKPYLSLLGATAER